MKRTSLSSKAYLIVMKTGPLKPGALFYSITAPALLPQPILSKVIYILSIKSVLFCLKYGKNIINELLYNMISIITLALPYF